MFDEPACEIQNEGQDVFVVVDGVKIAKRGTPYTALANTWIVIEPGWTVREVRRGKTLEVTYVGAAIH
jgi:hypothetical protein